MKVTQISGEISKFSEFTKVLYFVKYNTYSQLPSYPGILLIKNDDHEITKRLFTKNLNISLDTLIAELKDVESIFFHIYHDYIPKIIIRQEKLPALENLELLRKL